MKKVNQEQLQIDPSLWFNYWHAHDWAYEDDRYADLDGHLHELESMYTYLKGKAEQIDGDCQMWLSLNPSDPLQDAVYLHTPNPHTEFPHDLSDIEWTDDVPGRYQSLAQDRLFGRRAWQGHETCVIMESDH